MKIRSSWDGGSEAESQPTARPVEVVFDVDTGLMGLSIARIADAAIVLVDIPVGAGSTAHGEDRQTQVAIKGECVAGRRPPARNREANMKPPLPIGGEVVSLSWLGGPVVDPLGGQLDDPVAGRPDDPVADRLAGPVAGQPGGLPDAASRRLRRAARTPHRCIQTKRQPSRPRPTVFYAKTCFLSHLCLVIRGQRVRERVIPGAWPA